MQAFLCPNGRYTIDSSMAKARALAALFRNCSGAVFSHQRRALFQHAALQYTQLVPEITWVSSMLVYEDLHVLEGASGTRGQPLRIA